MLRLICALLLIGLAPVETQAAGEMAPKDFYRAFGVDPQDPDPEAAFKKAYRALVLRYHPDRNRGDKKAEAEMMRVNALMDEVRKKNFFAHLAPKRAAATPAPEAKQKPPPPPPPPPPPKPEPEPAPAPKLRGAAADAARAYAQTASEGAYVGGGTGGNYFDPYEQQYEKAEAARVAREKETAAAAAARASPHQECPNWFASIFGK